MKKLKNIFKANLKIKIQSLLKLNMVSKQNFYNVFHH